MRNRVKEIAEVVQGQPTDLKKLQLRLQVTYWRRDFPKLRFNCVNEFEPFREVLASRLTLGRLRTLQLFSVPKQRITRKKK